MFSPRPSRAAWFVAAGALACALGAGCGLSSGGTAGACLVAGAGGTSDGGGRAAPACGNDVREAGEACDDGNTNPGDGCSATCALEPDCGDVLLLGFGAASVSGNTSGVDVVASTTCDGGAGSPEHMYTLRFAHDGRLDLAVDGAFDKVVSLRELCGAGQELACASGAAGSAANLAYTVTRDTSYYLVVDGALGASGDYTIAFALEGCGDGVVNLAESCDDQNGDDADGCTSACAVACPASWSEFPDNHHCYGVSTSDADWLGARAACSARGPGYVLAALTSNAERAFAQGLLGGDTWVGADDWFSEGTYEWLSGEPWAGVPWASGEPNDGGTFGNEDCLEMYTDGLFNDEDCGTTQRSLCEFVPPGL